MTAGGYGTVDCYAEMIRETVGRYRRDHVDSVVIGILWSVITGPGTDAEVRCWGRNVLAAGDLVRSELDGTTADQSGEAAA